MNHPRHPHSIRLKRDERNPFECSGCKEVGFGPRYRCEKKNCHFFLHELCFKARPTDRPKTHPFAGANCRFKFIWTPPGGPNRRLCHACERDVRGFLYRVRSGNSWLYLHPCCMNLESTISDPSGGMKLILKDNIPSRCLKCESDDPNAQSRGPFRSGWSYVSSYGNFCFHVYCVKKLILDNWQRGYFNSVASSSLSPPSSSSSSLSLSSSSRGRSLARVEPSAASSSTSDRSLITSATSSLALPRRPWWKPQISFATRESLIKLAKICFCLIIAKLLAPQNPAPVFNVLTDKVLNI